MCTGNTQTVKCADGMCLACFDCCCCDGWTDLHGVYAWFTRLLEKPNRHMDDQDRCLLPCNLGSASPTHYSRYGSRFFYFCCRTKNQAELVLTRGKKEKKRKERKRKKKWASLNESIPPLITYNVQWTHPKDEPFIVVPWDISCCSMLRSTSHSSALLSCAVALTKLIPTKYKPFWLIQDPPWTKKVHSLSPSATQLSDKQMALNHVR